LLTVRCVQLVKGAFGHAGAGGGHSALDRPDRVAELMARPWLNLHEPGLAGFASPLAGEFAARRALLEAIAFPAGAGVEIAVLIDALRLYGLDALAECDLGTRESHDRALRELGVTAYAVLVAMENRRDRTTRIAGGRLLQPWQDAASIAVEIEERPPLRSLQASAAEAERASG
jgi:glucosyl-3-phosphoglycerate synthase